METGIIRVGIRQTIPDGRNQVPPSPSTIHVQLAGVFLMGEKIMCGRKKWNSLIFYVKVMDSGLVTDGGIQLRAIAAATMAASTMSVTAATIGLRLLAAIVRTTCTSATMTASIRRSTAIARTVAQSVASKNNI